MKVFGTLSIVTYIEIMYVPLSICVDVMLGHLGALVGAKVDPLLLLDMGSIFDVLLHGHPSADVNGHLLERLVGGSNCVDHSSLLEALPDLNISSQDAVCIISGVKKATKLLIVFKCSEMPSIVQTNDTLTFCGITWCWSLHLHAM